MSRDANDLGHILVVDDEEPVRDVLCEYLEGRGFGVEAAPDGETALAALGRHRPDLALLDVKMPGWTASKSSGASAMPRGTCPSSW